MAIYLYALIAVLVIGIAAAAPICLRHRRERKLRKEAFSYLRRSSDGEVYVTDPQTGTTYKLRNVLAKRIAEGRL